MMVAMAIEWRVVVLSRDLMKKNKTKTHRCLLTCRAISGMGVVLYIRKREEEEEEEEENYQCVYVSMEHAHIA